MLLFNYLFFNIAILDFFLLYLRLSLLIFFASFLRERAKAKAIAIARKVITIGEKTEKTEKKYVCNNNVQNQ